jgi:hypothetical protein
VIQYLDISTVFVPYLKVYLCEIVESGVPDGVVPIADLLGNFLGTHAHRGLQDVRAKVLDHVAEVVEALGPLFGVLRLDALHQIPAELRGRVDVGENLEDGPDAVADLVLGIPDLVDEIRDER